MTLCFWRCALEPAGPRRRRASLLSSRQADDRLERLRVACSHAALVEDENTPLRGDGGWLDATDAAVIIVGPATPTHRSALAGVFGEANRLEVPVIVFNEKFKPPTRSTPCVAYSVTPLVAQAKDGSRAEARQIMDAVMKRTDDPPPPKASARELST